MRIHRPKMQHEIWELDASDGTVIIGRGASQTRHLAETYALLDARQKLRRHERRIKPIEAGIEKLPGVEDIF